MFCTNLLDQITIILISRDDNLHSIGIQAGAKACCSVSLDSLHEDVFELIFAKFRYDSVQGIYRYSLLLLYIYNII